VAFFNKAVLARTIRFVAISTDAGVRRIVNYPSLRFEAYYISSNTAVAKDEK